MSNPSVTATITADDKASPKLRELVELTQRLSQTAKAAFSESTGANYTNSFRQATSAAVQHLSVLERIHKVQSAIGATVAGVAGAKAFQVARSAFTNYIPYERDVRYQRAIQHYSSADMALLERQRINAATVYGLKPEDTLHAQQAFVTRNFSAPITEATTNQAIVLAKALNVQTSEAAKIVEGLTFGQGIHLHNPAQAAREIARSSDLAAIAAKAGAMSPEDIQAFGKFGIGMSTAAGISAEQAFAAAMTLKRANVGGDESGVFMRQFSARLLAPTKQAFEAFAHMGINYSDFAPQGSVSPDAIDASLRRRYGKGLYPTRARRASRQRSVMKAGMCSAAGKTSRQPFVRPSRRAARSCRRWTKSIWSTRRYVNMTWQRALSTAGRCSKPFCKGLVLGIFRRS
ncbi:phage tail tape measure protein [Bradyrhizobium lupini]